MSFWKPGAKKPEARKIRSEALREDTEKDGGKIAVFNPRENWTIDQQRQSLPIFKYRTHILYLVEHFPVVIIVGQTGCGKTTRKIL